MARSRNYYALEMSLQEDMVCLSCTGTGERVCLSAEGFGNRQCFLEGIADRVRLDCKKIYLYNNVMT